MVQLYEKGDPPLSLNEAFTQSAATKADIAELRADLTSLKWVLGFNFAATLGVLLRVVTH